jgi:serine protease inhibitor
LTSLDYSPVARGNTRLGYDLLRRLDDTSNIVISPLSLSYAMAMVREGARGLTAAEIDRVLGFPRTGLGPLYNGVDQALEADDSDATVALNDALFVDPQFSVRQTYLVRLARYYGAGVFQTRFPDPALHDINAWVDQRTNGRIPKLLDQLDPGIVFALVNTLYLKAKWATPFDRSDTRTETFRTGTGSVVRVKSMTRTDPIRYYEGADYQAVRLDYRGGRLAMWVLLPKADARDPIRLLAPGVLDEAMTNAHEERVEVHLPRWDIETNKVLTDVLQELGIRALFTTADLSAMSPQQPVVSKVVQQANITVGEQGTEAAAATAVLGRTSMPAPNKPPIVFNADHPFAFAIVDNPTKAPLFEGIIENPATS